MDQEFVKFMMGKLGGEEAAREEYEKARLVEFKTMLPGEVIGMIRSHSEDSGTADNEIVEKAIRAYIESKSSEPPKRKRRHFTSIERVVNDECVLDVLSKQRGREGDEWMTAAQVAHHIDHLDREPARSTLDRLAHENKVLMDKQGRSIVYKIDPGYKGSEDVLRNAIAGVLYNEAEV